MTPLASNDDYSGLASRIVYTVTSSGSYRVKVRQYLSTQGVISYRYDLRLTVAGTAPTPTATTTPRPTATPTQAPTATPRTVPTPGPEQRVITYAYIAWQKP